MNDLAEAVAVRPSALYRHFSGKHDLLREVITATFAPMRELLDSIDLHDRATAFRQLSAFALDERRTGVLWQREARHLTPGDHAALRAELRAIGQRLTSHVLGARPDLNAHSADLIAWSVIAVLMSPSFHHLELPRPAYEELLAGLAATVLDTPLPGDFPEPGPARPEPPLVPHVRREALLGQAIAMFARSGYTGVGIGDIGAAAGIAGPSVYNHFPGKLDMLTTAFQRGTAALQMDVSAAYATAGSAADALGLLVRSYVGFTQRHHDLVDLMITETGNLPDTEQSDARRSQHEYISEWVHLFRISHPGTEPVAARIRVHAALTVANDAARTPHLRRNTQITPALERICGRLMMNDQA